MKGPSLKLIYIVIAAVAVVFYISSSNIRNIIKLFEEIRSHESRLEKLKKQNSEIKNEIMLINNEDEYIKYLARKRLGFVEPDETKYYIRELPE